MNQWLGMDIVSMVGLFESDFEKCKKNTTITFKKITLSFGQIKMQTKPRAKLAAHISRRLAEFGYVYK